MQQVTAVDPPDWMTLDGDEAVQLRATPSNNLILGALAFSGALILVMGVVLSVIDDLSTGRLLAAAMVGAVFAAIAAAYLVIQRYEYVVTDERVCICVGFSSHSFNEIGVQHIQEVTIKQSLCQGWMNVGNVAFTNADGSKVRFSFIENPAVIQETVAPLVEAANVQTQ
jgi:uncharacterized membrane protein YdbT with pleckstrin-like domain